jgi:predicted membrane protein
MQMPVVLVHENHVVRRTPVHEIFRFSRIDSHGPLSQINRESFSNENFLFSRVVSRGPLSQVNRESFSNHRGNIEISQSLFAIWAACLLQINLFGPKSFNPAVFTAHFAILAGLLLF